MKKNDILVEKLKKVLTQDKYISKMKHKDKVSYNVSKLLGGVPLTQSQAIKFGTIFQNFIKDWIVELGGVVSEIHFLDCYNTGNDGNKGKKDIDIEFTYRDKLYYFECKVNLDLDSEKSKATDSKVYDITKHLESIQDLPVISGVLTCWYKMERGFPVKVNNVFFVKDLLDIFNFDFSEKDYNEMLLEFGKIITE